MSSKITQTRSEGCWRCVAGSWIWLMNAKPGGNGVNDLQLEEAEPAMFISFLWTWAGIFWDAVGDPVSFVSAFNAYSFTQEKKNPLYCQCFSVNQKEGDGSGLSLSWCSWNGKLGVETFVPKRPGDAQSCQRKGDLTQFPRLFGLHWRNTQGKGHLGWGMSWTRTLLLCPVLTPVQKGMSECCRALFTIRQEEKNPIPICDVCVGWGTNTQCSPRSAHLGWSPVSISGGQTKAEARDKHETRHLQQPHLWKWGENQEKTHRYYFFHAFYQAFLLIFGCWDASSHPFSWNSLFCLESKTRGEWESS